jgi:hypothetical protein
MCEKCRALDERIDHYRKISCWVNDKRTLESIQVLIAKYEADKKTLHFETQRP